MSELSEAARSEHTVSEDRDDENVVNKFGYKQELSRSMGKFSTFAISFSLMSVTTGIFANYAFGLGEAGPSFIWTWPIVAIANILIALVLAHWRLTSRSLAMRISGRHEWCPAGTDGSPDGWGSSAG
jgi:hypothetical protein